MSESKRRKICEQIEKMKMVEVSDRRVNVNKNRLELVARTGSMAGQRTQVLENP